MALPKIDKPLYEETLPSNGKKLLYRAFTVKEEKILLNAKQSENMNQAIIAIKQVLANCLPDYDIDALSICDAEYMLTKIRAKSIDDIIELTIKDEHDKNIQIELDLNDVKIITDVEHTNVINLNENFKLMLKYPNLDILQLMFDPDVSKEEFSLNVLTECLDKLITPDTVYDLSEETPEEIEKFLDDLDKKNIDQITKFFDTSPHLQHEIKYKDSAGEEKTLILEGLQTFFM